MQTLPGFICERCSYRKTRSVNALALNESLMMNQVSVSDTSNESSLDDASREQGLEGTESMEEHPSQDGKRKSKEGNQNTARDNVSSLTSSESSVSSQGTDTLSSSKTSEIRCPVCRKNCPLSALQCNRGTQWAEQNGYL